MQGSHISLTAWKGNHAGKSCSGLTFLEGMRGVFERRPFFEASGEVLVSSHALAACHDKFQSNIKAVALSIVIDFLLKIHCVMSSFFSCLKGDISGFV